QEEEVPKSHENETGTASPRVPVPLLPPSVAGTHPRSSREGWSARIHRRCAADPDRFVRLRRTTRLSYLDSSRGRTRCCVFSLLRASVFRTLNSTRRFFARPSTVWFDAIGLVDP